MGGENTDEVYMWKTASPRPWFASSLKDVPLLYSRAFKGSPLSFETKSKLSLVVLFKLSPAEEPNGHILKNTDSWTAYPKILSLWVQVGTRDCAFLAGSHALRSC